MACSRQAGQATRAERTAERSKGRKTWNIRAPDSVSFSETRGGGGVKYRNMGQRQERISHIGLRIALTLALCGVLGHSDYFLNAQEKGSINVSVQGKDGSDAGLILSAQATAKEVGLPMYPGARPHKDEAKDSPAAQFGLWGNTFGFKLVLLKLESNDAPEKIAAFYQKALAKYGTVLNCSDPSQKKNGKDKAGSSNQLDCGDDKPEKGGLVFKAGTKEKQHIVGIQPNGQGTIFQLVYVAARGDDKGKKAD